MIFSSLAEAAASARDEPEGRYPEAAGEAEPFSGMLPLHLAAGNRATPAVVAALVAARPGAASVRDRMGRLPLHLAAEPSVRHGGGGVVRGAPARLPAHKAAAAVVAALLAAHPDGAQTKDGFGKLPLHLAAADRASVELVTALLAAHPGGAKEKDAFGKLPLHLAAAGKAEPDAREGKLASQTRHKLLVRTLLAAHPEGVEAKDNYGNRPLDLAARNHASESVVKILQGPQHNTCQVS